MRNDQNRNPGKSDVLVINPADLIAQLFYKWKWIFLIMIIGIAAALVLWMQVSKRPKVERILQRDIDEAREQLSEDKASQAEYLFAQYVSYLEYRKSIQTYLSDSLYARNDYEGNIALTALYYVKSDIGNVNQVFTRLAVGKDEYEKIAKIMEKDETMLDDVYRRVSISDVNSSDYQGNEYSYILDDLSEKDQKKMLLQVYLVAEDQEQADAVMDVIKASLDRKLNELKAVDENITMTFLGEKYSTDISGFLNNRQNNAVAYLNTVNDQINNLQTNYVDKLDRDVKEYYTLMKDKREQEISPPKKPSLLKYLLVGAFLGVVLSFGWFMLRYIFDGKAKTAVEMISPYQTEEPARVFRKMKGFHLFGGLARMCTGADLSGEAVQADMAASDIGIRLEKQGAGSVYLVTDSMTDWEKETAQGVADKLGRRETPISVTVGNPLTSPEELERFSVSEAVVLLAEMKHTKRSELNKWLQLCRRYELPVAGAIALEEC